MDDQTIEKLAEMLGKCAATGDSSVLVKQAGAEQLILPLLSATAGGAAGYLGTKKEKNKVRNAIYGALGSGLAGAGVQAALPIANDLISGKSDDIDLGGNPGLGAGGGLGQRILAGLSTASDLATKPIQSWSGAAGGAAALAGVNVPGASLASRAESGLQKLYDKVTGQHRHSGEFSAARRGALDTPRGKGVDDSLSRFFKDLFSKHGPGGMGQSVVGSLEPPVAPPGFRPRHPGRPPIDPILHPAFAAGHPASIQAVDAYNARRATWDRAVNQYLKDKADWIRRALDYRQQRDAFAAKVPVAESIAKGDSLGADAATRAKNFDVLAEMHRKMTGKELPPRVLTELASKHKGPVGRRVAGGVGRYGTNLAASYAGSALFDFLARYFGNLRSGAPSADK